MEKLPQTVESLSQLGMLHFGNENFDAAEKSLRKAVEKAHGNVLVKPLWLLSQVVLRNDAKGPARFPEAQKLMIRILAVLKNARQPLFSAQVTFALSRVVGEQQLFNQASYHCKAALHLLDEVQVNDTNEAEVATLRAEINEELNALKQRKDSTEKKKK